MSTELKKKKKKKTNIAEGMDYKSTPRRESVPVYRRYVQKNHKKVSQ
jgi:hypothetical protein